MQELLTWFVPREPRQQETNGPYRSAVQYRLLTVTAELPCRLILEISEQGIVDRIPDHVDYLEGENFLKERLPADMRCL